jgi:catalase
VSMDRETYLRAGNDNEPGRSASMRLGAERPRVTRLSRKVLAGAAAVGSAAIFGATFWALQNNRPHTSAPSELYTTDHHNVADGLTGLPRDYAGVPRQAPPLGPPLPGDLGRPILNAQNAPSAGTAAIDSDQQRLDQEIEAARLSRLFASTSSLFIQVMTDAQAKAFPFNPFDLTKVWPKGDFPLIEVGYFELNRNPENVFAEVEQAAFSPANIVPGISYSPDKMLQGRLFSYGDAQRYRLGVNHHHIPVNAPKCPFHSYHRDGAMRTDGNLGGTPTYFPNSRGEWIDQPLLNEPPLELEGAAAHWDHRVDDDHYQQPGNLFRKMTAAQQQMLFDNTVRQIGGAARHIQERHAANCAKADPAYGAGVAKALSIDLKSNMIAAE